MGTFFPFQRLFLLIVILCCYCAADNMQLSATIRSKAVCVVAAFVGSIFLYSLAVYPCTQPFFSPRKQKK